MTATFVLVSMVNFNFEVDRTPTATKLEFFPCSLCRLESRAQCYSLNMMTATYYVSKPKVPKVPSRAVRSSATGMQYLNVDSSCSSGTAAIVESGGSSCESGKNRA